MTADPSSSSSWRRSLHTCCFSSLLVLSFLLNLAIIAASVASVALLVFLGPPLSSALAWACAASSLLALLSGLLGAASPGRFSCFGLHLLVHALAAGGSLACTGLLLLRPGRAQAFLQPVADAAAQPLLLAEGSAQAALCGLLLKQLAVVGGVMLAAEEEEEGQEGGRAKEVDVEGYLEGEGSSSRARRLHDAMRAKYGLEGRPKKKRDFVVLESKHGVSEKPG